jgi:alkylation response protein AidB-like acyl-CoA dehydrogenase
VDFEYTEQQRLIRDMIGRFADAEIRPKAAALDGRGESPLEIVRHLGELKMMGITVPEEYGGGGMDHVSYALALMEVSKACASTGAVMVVNNSLYCSPVAVYGSHEQKMRYLYPCASGDRIGCYGLAEADGGSDPSDMRTMAARDGDEWVLNGEKRFITGGSLASYCVLAAVTKKGRGREGIGHFVLDLEHTPGFRVGRTEETLGFLAAGTAEMIFEDARVPGDALLGGEGDGFDQMVTILAGAWIGIAAQAVGIGRAVLEEALEFATTRQQSGRPLSSSQSVQWKLADMATELDAAELLTQRAAWLLDLGKPYEKEAAMARMFASDATMRASIEGVQVLGEYGYSKAYPMERHMRDAKICQIYEGTNEVMRRVVAENLIKGNRPY